MHSQIPVDSRDGSYGQMLLANGNLSWSQGAQYQQHNLGGFLRHSISTSVVPGAEILLDPRNVSSASVIFFILKSVGVASVYMYIAYGRTLANSLDRIATQRHSLLTPFVLGHSCAVVAAMEGLPQLLKIGSTNSIDNSSAPIRPAPTCQHNFGSDRLSQLFPPRPISIESPISPASSHDTRTSYPSPLVPAAEPGYRIPRASAPPSFPESTLYDPVIRTYNHQGGSSDPPSKSGTRRLLSRLTSLRIISLRGGNYNKLEDEVSEPFRQGLDSVEEPDGAEEHDLSGCKGLPLKNTSPQIKISSTLEAGLADRDLQEASHAAEFERLKGQLGAGMTSIFQQPFTHNPVQSSGRPSGGPQQSLSVSGMTHAQARDAQEEADTKGGIVAVTDGLVDLSESIVDTDFDRRSSAMMARTELAPNETHTSYFFPSDPDMSTWRPFTMSWPWISMLIVFALGLSGLQEFLCQWSLGKVEKNSGDGILRFEKVGDLTVAMYFAWQYAPIMLFVFYGILWQMTDFEVKRLEPFYQLSKRNGATAGESLNMDYLTFISWAVPLKALRHKQYAVIYSSTGTLIASSVVPVLQASSVEMYRFEGQEPYERWKAVRIVPSWSRAVSGCLLIVAFCGATLMYAMRRKSGLQSDPKGIAGIAAMATRSHILADFHGLDKAPLDKIHKQLRHRRYILHKSSLWQGKYIRNSTEKIQETGTDPRPLMLRKRFILAFIVFIVTVTAATPVFTFVETAGAVTLKLPFLMTGLVTIIRMLWNTMNTDVRMLQPFWILAQRRAPAKTLTLDYAGTNPLYLPFKAFFNGDYLVMLVAFGSILAEILTVCVSSIGVDGKKFIPGLGGADFDDNHDGDNNDPNDRYNTEQTFRSFWSSYTLAMSILLYLIGIALLTYTKRSHRFMPRQIGTMASVLAFIHQSKMLVNFVDTETFDSRTMTKHLEQSGKTYGGKTYALGWFVGRDGEDHMGIDEEEILSGYTYGYDWAESRLRSRQIGMWEHYEKV